MWHTVLFFIVSEKCSYFKTARAQSYLPILSFANLLEKDMSTALAKDGLMHLFDACCQARHHLVMGQIIRWFWKFRGSEKFQPMSDCAAWDGLILFPRCNKPSFRRTSLKFIIVFSFVNCLDIVLILLPICSLHTLKPKPKVNWFNFSFYCSLMLYLQ